MSLTPLSAEHLLVDPHRAFGGSYRTIQEAADAARPGDSVEIVGGVYREQVVVTTSGTQEAPITFRPYRNQPVVLYAGVPVPGDGKEADGYPGIRVFPVEPGFFKEKAGIWEMPARVRLAAVDSLAQVTGRIGSWYYDRDQHLLYIHPGAARKGAVSAFWREASQGAAMELRGHHLRVEGLQAALGEHGFLLAKGSHHLVLERNRAFANTLAGIHVSGRDHRIIANRTYFNNTYGIQLRFEMERNVVAGNWCWLNGPNNGAWSGNSIPTDLGIYGKGAENLFEGNVVDGVHEDAFRNKGSQEPGNRFTGNVVRGNMTVGQEGVEHNTLLVSGLGMRPGMFRNGGGVSPERTWERVDPEGVLRARNLIHPVADAADPEFADPAYYDFRLQAGSPYTGRGAYRQQDIILYIDPQKGDDRRSGTSRREAVATLARGLELSAEGATLYLLPGRYNGEVTVKGRRADAPARLRLRAYGRSGEVVVNGEWKVEDCRGVEIEGLRFEGGGLKINRSHEVLVKNCFFVGTGARVGISESGKVALEQVTSDLPGSEAVITVEKSREVRVVGSLFKGEAPAWRVTTPDEGELYADFNAFASFTAWVGKEAVPSLAEWQKRYPSSRNQTLLVDGKPLPSAADFSYPGVASTVKESIPLISELRVAGLHPHGGTLLWKFSGGVAEGLVRLLDESGKQLAEWRTSCRLEIFASSYDMMRTLEGYYESARHTPLRDLQLGRRYRVEVTPVGWSGAQGKAVALEWTQPLDETPGRVCYISPDGDDRHTGLERSKPWRTLAHSMEQLRPGDELVLLPGVYGETLRPRVSGSAEQRIVIRSETPQAARLAMRQRLPVAVELTNVDNVTIRGLLIDGGLFPYSLPFAVHRARGITLEEHLVAYPEGSDFDELKLGYAAGVLAHEVSSLTVRDNVLVCCVSGITVSLGEDVRIENNTLLGAGNYGIVIISDRRDARCVIRNNLFERPVMGYKSNPAIWLFGEKPRMTCDHNLFHIPENFKGTVGALPSGERLLLSAWQEASGFDRHSIMAKPEFADPERLDFRLRPGSPGSTLAEDGGAVGRRASR